MHVGVLALQGAFARHGAAFAELGAEVSYVRTPADLDGVRALAMPGGESTAMSRLLTTSGLFDELQARIDGGLPVFGTCAGLILLAREVLDGRPDQRSFAAIDVTVRRNGYGRQVDSFEADLDVAGLDVAGPDVAGPDVAGPDVAAPDVAGPAAAAEPRPFHAVFIRAPVVTAFGADVTVLASHEGVPVLLRQGRITVASFHPELTDDHRLHAQFLQEVA